MAEKITHFDEIKVNVTSIEYICDICGEKGKIVDVNEDGKVCEKCHKKASMNRYGEY